MLKRRRILLGSLFHETHSFVDEITTLADFAIRRGEQLLQRRGDGSTVDGFLAVAAAEDWEVLPTVDYTALPAGTVDHAVFERFLSEFDAGLRAALASGGLDGIWLALHGAMVTTGSHDPEGALLAHIRSVPGCETLPVFGVFDLHANFTAAMAQHANALVAYRENPHTDARGSAMRSAELLARALNSGEVPRMLSANAPAMWPPTGTGTADRPMKDLEALARRIERETPAIWVANVVGGYSFSDVPDAGVAFAVAFTGPEADAVDALARLIQTATDLRELGLPAECDIDQAITEILRSPGGRISSSSPPTISAVALRVTGPRCCAPSCGTASRTAPSPSPIQRPLRRCPVPGPARSARCRSAARAARSPKGRSRSRPHSSAPATACSRSRISTVTSPPRRARISAWGLASW